MYAKDTGGWNSPRGWGADVQTILDRMIKLSSVLWSPQMASGKTFPKLDPRTLPNSVKNTDWVQNVSGDVVLNGSEVYTQYAQTNIDNPTVRNFFVSIPNLNAPIGSMGAVSDKIPTVVDCWAGVGYLSMSTYPNSTSLHITIETSRLATQDVAGFKAWLAQNPLTIRYQLATPIDKLNSPFVNPLIDLKGRVGKNLVDHMRLVLFSANKYVGTLNYTTAPGITLKKNTTYRLSFFKSWGDGRIKVFAGNVFKRDVYTNVVTLVGDEDGISFYAGNFGVSPFDTLTLESVLCQVEEGSIATTYEPYGKANLLLKNFAGTQASGYVDVPCITGRGQAINFKNLLGADGNFPVDSNADGLADGWIGTNANFASKSIANNIQTFKLALADNPLGHSLQSQLNDLIYVFAYVKATSGAIMSIGCGIPGVVNFSFSNKTGDGNFNFMSSESTITNTTSPTFAMLKDTRASGFDDVNVKLFHALNETTMFPDPSTRPSKKKMDELVQTCIKKYGYVNEQVIMIEWVPMLKFDGATSYGMANHPSLDIVGTGDFAIATVFKTGATQINECLVSRSNGGFQYLLYLPGAALNLFLNANEYSLFTTMKVNTLYKCLVYRKSGVLKCRVMDVETYNSPNVINVITKDNFRVGNYSLNAGGTNHAAYTNVALGHLSIVNGAITPFTEADLIAKWDKYTQKTFGI